jgi:hypothetical protein
MFHKVLLAMDPSEQSNPAASLGSDIKRKREHLALIAGVRQRSDVACVSLVSAITLKRPVVITPKAAT